MLSHSESIKELAGALAKAQADLRVASKDTENPFFRSRYADLAEIWDVARGPMTKNGISITQHPSTDGAKVTVQTLVTHASGEWMLSDVSAVAKDSSPQSVGSATTFLRRYALQSIAGIAADVDDDGEAAQGREHEDPPKKQSKPAAKMDGGDAANKVKAAMGNGSADPKARKAVALAKLQKAGQSGKQIRAELAKLYGRTFPETGEITLQNLEELEKLEQYVVSVEHTKEAGEILGAAKRQN